MRGWRGRRNLGVCIGFVVCLLGLLALPSPGGAQQEVTLSGRVTDQAGQPVPGAFVFFQRMPGFVFIRGDTTQSDGTYRLTVPPGTYRLTVDPKRGPLIPQAIETFALAADTTRDFALARGFTLSGRVTDPSGAPVAQAFVGVDDQNFRRVSFSNTDDAGRYSLGAPPGTYRVSVSTSGRFIVKQIDDVVLDRDRTLDIALQSGVIIEGKVVDESGQPLLGVNISADDPTVGVGTAEFFDLTRSDGTFRLNVPAAVYVVTADPLLPLNPTRVRVDARGGNVTGLVLQVSSRPAAFVPDSPPRASLIQLSLPDAGGDVTVTGAPGAVPAGSSVFLVTLDTGHVSLAQAAADGSFSGSVFAPSGTSILVKADPLGISFGAVFNSELLAGGTGFLSAVPGTIVRVPDPPATGVPFGGAGWTQRDELGQSPLPAWTFQGTINTQQLSPGGTLRVQGTLRIVSPALQAAGAMRAGGQLSLQRLSRPDGVGALAENSYASVFLTPTGLPIERSPRFANEGLDQSSFVNLTKLAADRAEGTVDLSLRIPADLPAGFYRPRVTFFTFDGVPVESPPGRRVIQIDRALRRPKSSADLPIIQVGTPAPPRLFWILLGDTLSNGTRGTRALEDRDRFGMASRILTQSETFIVPRLDPASGQPLTYRLEPFAPTVSLADQVPPNPPLIPFRFPSGRLTVRIQKPDGSVEVLGPAPFVQSRMKSLAHRDGLPLDRGGGHITDLYELSTMDPRFEVQFTQDGRHVITLEGTIEDIWGNTWTGGGTYEVHVARLLSLDTAVLPMMPFEVGDVFNPGLVLTPPVPADVEVRFRLAPNSDASRMVERVVKGRANRFGKFQPFLSGIVLDQPGEYRVDVVASFTDEQGALWMGARTWGGVVAPRNPKIIAHGRRGIDKGATIGPQWFFRTQTGTAIGGNHVPFPFNSGDIMWQQKSDAAIPLVAFQDPTGSLVSLLRARMFNSTGQLESFPKWGPGTFDERAAVGEVPLFSSRPDRMDPHLDSSKVDLWGYSYRSVQRPLVRVREEIGEDRIPPAYWRFGEQYAAQIGVGRNGDLPNEIKFQYGAAVLRGSALASPKYAIYGSLFVLVPDDDPRGGSRTFPPFQSNGGGPSGGPIMTLRGRDIDLFIHLTGVRPSSVLEVGDTFAVAGAVGPALPALVSYTVTKPSGQQLSFSGRANRVGYYYHSEHDFLVDQPGLYNVELRVTYDGLTSAGQVTAPFPTGDVLGSANGRFVVYVVPRDSIPLTVDLPRNTVLPPPASLDVSARIPAGRASSRGHVTTMMPGFVLEARDLTPGATLAYRYDPVTLAQDFPNLDVTFRGQPDAADAITLSLFASGTSADGTPTHAARVLALHGPELLNLPVPASLAAGVEVTLDRASYQPGQALTLSLHLTHGSTLEPVDLYVGLIRPDGTAMSLLVQEGRLELVPTGLTVMPILRGIPVVDLSLPVVKHLWTAADPVGGYIAFGLLVRVGQAPLNTANWVAADAVNVTLNP